MMGGSTAFTTKINMIVSLYFSIKPAFYRTLWQSNERFYYLFPFMERCSMLALFFIISRLHIIGLSRYFPWYIFSSMYLPFIYTNIYINKGNPKNESSTSIVMLLDLFGKYYPNCINAISFCYNKKHEHIFNF